MCAISGLGWGAYWCRFCNGGCILWNGWKLLFAKGQPGWAGSLFPMPTLFLAVRSLLFGIRKIRGNSRDQKNSYIKKQTDGKSEESDKRRLHLMSYYVHPKVAVPIAQGSNYVPWPNSHITLSICFAAYQEAVSRQVRALSFQLSLQLTDAVQNNKSSHNTVWLPDA